MPGLGEERPRGEALLRDSVLLRTTAAGGPGTLGQRQAVDGPGQTLLGGEGGLTSEGLGSRTSSLLVIF